MLRKKQAEELSVQDIRFLLVEKRRAWRHSRLQHFHKTGRVLLISNEIGPFEIKQNNPILQRTTKVRIPSWLDRSLLFLEILAIVSLLAVVTSDLLALKELNQKAASAIQLPTLVPTPLIREVVLPDGHTPPNRPGGAKPNEAEIPVHLRPVWQSLSNLPTPIPSPQQAIRIQIPSIDVDAPVVQGDGWEQLMKGVAQHIGTPNPGDTGNIVLSGHNDIYGEVFRDLDRLIPGDRLILFTNRRQYTYVVTGTQMVEPTAIEVMASTSDARVTLISCHPYLVVCQA